MTARQAILNRIREAHALAPPTAPAYEQVDRTYRDQPTRSLGDIVELLVDRLIDYEAIVHQCTVEKLPETIAVALAEHGVGRVVVPSGLAPEWTGQAEVDVAIDDPVAPLTVPHLDEMEGVITGCAVAAAETGTLVLDASPDQGRRAITLVPDCHLCVVARDAIVPDLPEMITRMEPARPLTMISGPSATSDIELDRVDGVHGLRTLVVVIAHDGSRGIEPPRVLDESGQE